jgi:serine/threonine protein kinase
VLGEQAAMSVHIVGRYELYGIIAQGGMARVHYGRLRGPAGFSRTVAVKRLHPSFAADPEFAAMLLDEARLAARVRHPNVVSMLDVVAMPDELLLVMEFVLGESLGRFMDTLAKSEERVPTPILVAIVADMLNGLHAAHEATDEVGKPLSIVHRDVSPENVLVGADGHARILDFGIAKATGRSRTTHDGRLRGKLAYMAPEQLRGLPVDRRTDVFAAAVVLWELVTGKRLFKADNEGAIVQRVLEGEIPPITDCLGGRGIRLEPEEDAWIRRIDEVAQRSLERDPARRFSTALEMATALENSAPRATPNEVAAWAERIAGRIFEQRRRAVAEVESGAHAIVHPKDLGLAPPAPQTSPTSLPWGTLPTPQPSPRARRIGMLLALAVLLIAPAAFFLASTSRSRQAVVPPAASPSTVAPSVLVAPAGLVATAASALGALSTTTAPPPTVATALNPAVRTPSGRRPPLPKTGDPQGRKDSNAVPSSLRDPDLGYP